MIGKWPTTSLSSSATKQQSPQHASVNDTKHAAPLHYAKRAYGSLLNLLQPREDVHKKRSASASSPSSGASTASPLRTMSCSRLQPLRSMSLRRKNGVLKKCASTGTQDIDWIVLPTEDNGCCCPKDMICLCTAVEPTRRRSLQAQCVNCKYVFLKATRAAGVCNDDDDVNFCSLDCKTNYQYQHSVQRLVNHRFGHEEEYEAEDAEDLAWRQWMQEASAELEEDDLATTLPVESPLAC